MTRKRTILFLSILLALLLVPTVLPYLIGHLLLPFWAYLLYAFILLVNAGIYLANRLWLIDRFFIQGRVGAFSAWNLALLLWSWTFPEGRPSVRESPFPASWISERSSPSGFSFPSWDS